SDQRAPAPQGSESNERTACSAIAVVGMAVRFPGASNAEEFWQLLMRGECAVRDVPQARWDVEALFDPTGRRGTSISHWGGFLDDIESFDPEWFGMADQEARCLDPAIRLFLEGAEACLRDSGRQREDLRAERVGVFVGARLGDYRMRVDLAGIEGALGRDQNFIAARLAHHLDLHGPNMVVDSACSSSLTAVHLACDSLRSGESDLAIAGGVDVLLDESVYLQFTAARALSRSGRCRTFDKGADGFVPGEGCGVFLLKRLDRALQDGDRIHAVIEGSAVNNDGRTMGLTTPNPEAQREVVAMALARARRGAREIGYLEAHGTATMIGDPIELRALTETFRKDTPDRGFCAIGSVKTNVGHLLSAAGAAGLAKVVLAVERGAIPPTLFCETPNPRFDLATSPFVINQEARPWDAARPRLAGVSAFGLGGTNAHLVVSEPPVHAPRRAALAPPQFRRRRLWLERPPTQSSNAPPETLSLLELNFVSAVDARPSSRPGPSHAAPPLRSERADS
ncbi:MAG: sle, partial [Myxococcaceae bacterium]|nr:sle [Myxococcaceae bacterium]